MISALQANKFYFEDLFFKDWASTPVHFAGQEFSADNLPEWINPTYHPRGGTIFGLSGDATELKGSLHVVCWADNDVKVMALSDKVVDFISQKVDNSLFRIKGFEVVDHAWHESNSVYLVLSFNIESYEGICSIKEVVEYIVDHGVPVFDNGDQVIDKRSH